jgi:hypothetical protein
MHQAASLPKVSKGSDTGGPKAAKSTRRLSLGNIEVAWRVGLNMPPRGPASSGEVAWRPPASDLAAAVSTFPWTLPPTGKVVPVRRSLTGHRRG